MSKILKYDSDVREAILNGVTKLEKAVASTLGPRGRTVLIDEGRLFDTLENKGWIKSLLDPEVQKKRMEKYKKILAGEEEDFYLIKHWKKEGLELTPEAIIEDDIKFATNWLIDHES